MLNFCDVLEEQLRGELEQKLEKKFMRKGLQKGMQKGIEQGIEQGIEKSVRQMLINGLPIAFVSKCLELSEEAVKKNGRIYFNCAA